MIRRLIILLLIVGCEEPLEPEDCAGVAGGTAELDNCNVCDSDPINDCVQDCDEAWGGENNYCLQADYRYSLEIGNRWEYEIAYSGNEVIVGESAGDMTGNIIVTIIDTVTLLDSINTYKFEHILIGLDYNSQIDTSYIYGNNNEDAFVIYATSGYSINGFPRAEIGLNGFSYNTIFDPFGSHSNFYNDDSDCNNSIYYYSPEWKRILYPINSDVEWVWFDENTNYILMCEDTDSTYVISQSNPYFSTLKSYGDTTTYTFNDQLYESFTINTEWQGLADGISVSTLYSNIGLMYEYFNLGEQVGMDEFGNPIGNWESFITVQLIDFQVLTADELIEPIFGCTNNQAVNYDSIAQYNDGSCQYEFEFADEHWDFGRWVHDYYKWYEYIEGNDDWNAIREVFVNKTDTLSSCHESPYCYTDIWSHSHKVEFTWEGNIVSSSDENIFKPIFKELCGNQMFGMETCKDNVHIVQSRIDNDDIYVIKDHHFYEGIQKYNMFIAGWDDNDSVYVITNNDGSKEAMTPHKLYFQGLFSNP